MTKYAYFDHWAAAPAPVSGWYDTAYFSQYDTLPAAADLLLMTEEEWDARLTGLWAVDSGALVPYTPPVPPPTADEVMAEKIAAGILLTSLSNPSINGLWALDERTMIEMGSVARDFAAGLGLPFDAPVFVYPNMAGTPVTLTGFDVMNIYKAQRDMIASLAAEASVMRLGGTPDWPSQEANIP